MVAIIIDAIAYKKHSATIQKVSRKGIILSVAAGVLMSLFYRFVASSMVTDFSVPEAGKLTPYSALFFFATGVVISNFFFNYILMKKPMKVMLSFSDYKKEAWPSHRHSWRLIWNMGM